MGLFNRYVKPGPGISKNQPQKNAVFRFVEIYFRKFWQLCLVNLLYVLVSLPAVTVGLADVGIAYVTRNFAREKHSFVVSDFFETIRKNWKQALPVGFVNLAVTALLIYNLLFYSASKIPYVNETILTVISSFLLLVFVFMQYYIPLMIVTFKLGWKQLYKNALILAFVGLLPNLVITILLVPFYLMLIYCLFPVYPANIRYPLLFILGLIYLFVFPAFRAFLTQFCTFPVVKKYIIDPYYKNHPDKDIRARQALDLEVPEQPDEPEPIFQDRGREEQTETTTDTRLIPRQYSPEELGRLQKLDLEDDDNTI